MDGFDVAFALEGLETTVEDGLVQVCAFLDIAHPDTISLAGVDDIEDQAFVGAEVLESGKRKSAKRLLEYISQ